METLLPDTSANPIVSDQPDRPDRPDQLGESEATHSGAAITRAATIVSLGNVLSSGLGLIRETVKSHFFGASGFVSAYNVAAIVPSMLYDLLVGGLVSSALVPMFSELAAKKDRTELWQLLSLLLSVAVVFLSLAVLVIELFAPTVARFMAGGFDEQLLQVTIDLLRLTVPAVLFLSLSSVLSGVLYALKRFAFPAFSAPLYNGTMIVVAIILADRFGIAAMALGLLAGSILQVMFQLPALRGATIRWRFDLHDPALRKMLKLYTPVLGGLLIGQVAVALEPESGLAHGRVRHRADGLSDAADPVSAGANRQRRLNRDPAVVVAACGAEFDRRFQGDAGAGPAVGAGVDDPLGDRAGRARAQYCRVVIRAWRVHARRYTGGHAHAVAVSDWPDFRGRRSAVGVRVLRAQGHADARRRRFDLQRGHLPVHGDRAARIESSSVASDGSRHRQLGAVDEPRADYAVAAALSIGRAGRARAGQTCAQSGYRVRWRWRWAPMVR